MGSAGCKISKRQRQFTPSWFRPAYALQHRDEGRRWTVFEKSARPSRATSSTVPLSPLRTGQRPLNCDVLREVAPSRARSVGVSVSSRAHPAPSSPRRRLKPCRSAGQLAAWQRKNPRIAWQGYPAASSFPGRKRLGLNTAGRRVRTRDWFMNLAVRPGSRQQQAASGPPGLMPYVSVAGR